MDGSCCNGGELRGILTGPIVCQLAMGSPAALADLGVTMDNLEFLVVLSRSPQRAECRGCSAGS